MTDAPTRIREVYTQEDPQEKPGAPVILSEQEVFACTERMQDIIARAPVGSVVVWRVTDAPLDHPLVPLHTMKLGDDAFAAHGLADERTRFSAEDIEKCLLERVFGPHRTTTAVVYPSEVEVLRSY